MKVLFITHYGRLYGANRSLLTLVKGLQNKGIEPHILSFEEGEAIDFFKQQNLDVKVVKSFPWIVVGLKEWLYVPFRLVRDILKFPYLLYWVNKLKPDVIYSNSSIFETGILLSLCLGKPHVWHIREFGWKDYKVKYVLPKFIRNILFGKSDKLIAISKAIGNEVLDGHENVVVYNGIVDVKDIPSQPRQLNKEKDSIVFSIIGQLMPTKGQMVAINAFANFYKTNKNARLIVAGDGDLNYLNQLKQVVNEQGLESVVTFTGFVSDVKKVYNETDIFLMCSYSEGMGRVTVEALAHGIPVIGFAGGATGEIVKDGLNGYLYHEFEDHHSLSELMKSTANNPQKYTQLSTQALVDSKRFTRDEYVNAVFNEIQDVYPTNS